MLQNKNLTIWWFSVLSRTLIWERFNSSAVDPSVSVDKTGNPQKFICPVGWGCRIHRPHLCKGVWHDTKRSDGKVPVMLELCGMRRTPSIPSLPGPLWPRVVALDRVLSMGQIDRTHKTAYLCLTELLKIEQLWHLNCVLMLNWIVWNGTALTLKLYLR